MSLAAYDNLQRYPTTWHDISENVASVRVLFAWGIIVSFLERLKSRMPQI
jgi:hypothetical protein